MLESLPIFLRSRSHNSLSCVSLTLEMFLLLEAKNVASMNVIYIAHFKIRTILNMYNPFL